MNKQLFALTRGLRWWIVLGVLLGWLLFGLNVAQIVLIGYVLDQALQGIGLSLGSVLGVVAIFAGIFVLRAALTWLSRMITDTTAAKMKLTLRDRLYTHIQRLGPAYLSNQRTGAVVNTVVEGVERLGTYVSLSLPQLVLAFSIPVFVLGYIATLDYVIALALLAAQVLLPIVLLIFRWLFGNVGERFWSAINALSAQFLDGLQGMTILKMFTQSRAYGDSLQRQSDKLRWITMDRLFIRLFSLFFTEWIATLGTVVIATGLAGWRIQEGLITFGSAIVIVLLSIELLRPLRLLWDWLQAGTSGFAASRQILAILETQPRVREIEYPIVPRDFSPRIGLENVRFSYETNGSLADKPLALDGISFKVPPGETVALVGASGAGKTTVVNLLFRFYEPQEGQVFVGGHQAHTLSLAWMRSQMALVAQQTYLFYGSIADNLRLANPDATQEQMEEAARIANVHEFIETLPSGYQTHVGERGVSLSGGQAQRLAIARAVLKNTPIIILDEATSQVDVASEAIIQQSLEQITADRTVLMIAHRLSTVRNADRILVMNEGQIVESGTHDELIAQDGIYAGLVAAQRVSSTVPITPAETPPQPEEATTTEETTTAEETTTHEQQ